MKEWIMAHEEYEWLLAERRKQRIVMDAIGQHAIRCFILHGGTYLTRDNPAYLRYKSAWRRRCHRIQDIIDRMKAIQEEWS